MAKFCVYCGRPLQEGEVCNCRAQSAGPAAPAQTAAPAQAAAPVQAAAQAPAAPAQPASSAVAGYWNVCKDFFRFPSSVLPSFTASGDRKTALVFIITRAVCFGLFMLVVCNQIKSSMSSVLGSLFSLLGSSGGSQLYDFPLAKIFFLSLVLSAGAAFVFAAIILLFVKYLFKAEASYDNALCATAAGSVAAVPFLLVGLLVVFLNMNFGLYIAAFGILLQLLFTVLALGSFRVQNAEKAIYAVFLILAVQAIVIALLIHFFAPMYLPDVLQDAVKHLKSGAAGVSGLLGGLS